MTGFTRYAIYYTPNDALADFGASWLGWDIRTATPRAHPALPGLTAGQIAALTDTPRRYGFHATLKAPFYLAQGVTPDDLAQAVDDLATRLSSVTLAGGLQLAALGSFVALVPQGDQPALQDLAAALVRDLDHLRAPLGAQDIARRNPDALPPVQRDYLMRWGYPYVLDQFRFHMTLTGPVADPTTVMQALAPALAPLLPDPHLIDTITLSGQRPDGQFQMISCHALRR